VAGGRAISPITPSSQAKTQATDETVVVHHDESTKGDVAQRANEYAPVRMT
jgi:hypothetical protein